jgi:hypothetical protein
MTGKRLPVFMAMLAAAALPAAPLGAADHDASPSDYTSVLPTLQPGDTLHLAAGTYNDLLNISGLNGSEGAWIAITGPESGDPAVIMADPGPCCNTIEITASSYVVIRNLTVDGGMVDGAFGLSAKDGESNLVHHIAVEGCMFINHDTSQQNVAISTKTPTWGWVIRGNVIDGAGTGMYLGNSDGTCPFVGGLIEGNYITDTIGYNMQIKWQLPRPAVEGMPTDPQRTIIRHNVFIKNDRASEDGDRPNLLVGGFPDSGPGAQDMYEIYGNFFYHNPRESLMQASGRVSVHDNVFVDVAGTAVTMQDHDLPLKLAWVYNNTIFAAGRGISVAAAGEGAAVVGNLVFSDDPISAGGADQRDNMTDTVGNAAAYVADPSLVLGEMDFYPLAGRCQGSSLDLSLFAGNADYDRDFNGTGKGSFAFRGAYAGEGENPGWQLDAGPKGELPPVIPDEEAETTVEDPGTEPVPDTSTDATVDTVTDVQADLPFDFIDEHTEEDGEKGCGCAVAR